MTRLQRLDWPDHGTPDLPPAFSVDEAEARLAAVRGSMLDAGYQALVVYGDREHAANLHWLRGLIRASKRRCWSLPKPTLF